MTLLNSFRREMNWKKVMPYLLALIVGISLEIAATTYMPMARKPLFDSLEAYNLSGFYWGVGMYAGVYFVLASCQGMKTWLEQKVGIVARKALMDTMIHKYVEKGGVEVSNPGARLIDDIRVVTNEGFITAIEILISLSIVIGLAISMSGQPVLLLSAFVYSGISIGLALFFRKPMMQSKYALLDAEGHNRSDLTFLHIGRDGVTLDERWEAVQKSFLYYIGVMRNYKYFGAMQTALMIAAPFFILAPGYFAHELTIGDVIKGTAQFDLMVVNAAIGVTLYPVVVDFLTSFKRINELYNEVHK